MQLAHGSGSHGHRDASGFPTLTFAWLHLVLALSCAALAITAAVAPLLAIVGMAFFGGIAIICAILTITK